MKFQLARTMLLTGLITLLSVGISSAALGSVAAAPLGNVAAAVGSFCTLPDGSSTGQIGKDGRTCCPRGYASAEQCLYAKYLNPTIQLLSAIVGLAIVIAIIYGGIEYITSADDPQRAAAGKKRIIEALVGLTAFLLLYGLIQFLIPGGMLNNG